LATAFHDARLRYLAERLIHEEWPDVLDEDTLARIDAEVRGRHLANADAPWTTVASALRDIQKLLVASDNGGKRILREYREYLIAQYPIANAAE
jgi:hypothetical protein